MYYFHMICWKCNKEIGIDQIFRTTECPICHAQLHSCKGCKFYAPGSHFDCKESVDDPVSDKERANFCDYFSPILNGGAASGSNSKEKADAAKAAFNALFGGSICF